MSRVVKCLGLSVLLAACEPATPHALTWTVTTANDEIITTAVAFEAEIRRDACAGVVLHRDTFDAMGETSRPPLLEPGDYAFVVRARDVDCGIVGSGCTLITLPTAEPSVEVILERVVFRMECGPDATCEGGRCVGGVPDASLPDAPPPDTSPPDALPPDTGTADAADAAPPDATPVDTGMPECLRDDECDDGNPCTEDRCQMGGCSNADTAGSCEDGRFCNGTDSCVSGSCRHSGSPCPGICDEDRDACGSDCGSLNIYRRCSGGTLVYDGPATSFCASACENFSVTSGQPVNCCESIQGGEGFPPPACLAYVGATVVTTSGIRHYAGACTPSP